MRWILVILGAGASYDCVDEEKSSINKDFRPPLTSQIFDRRYSGFPNGEIIDAINPFKESILNKHILASSAGHEFTGDNLEAYLARLKDSHLASDRRKFVALYFFINELFSQISVMLPIKQGEFKLEQAGCFLTKSVHKIATESCC